MDNRQKVMAMLCEWLGSDAGHRASPSEVTERIDALYREEIDRCHRVVAETSREYQELRSAVNEYISDMRAMAAAAGV